jgi:hypothetical protein
VSANREYLHEKRRRDDISSPLLIVRQTGISAGNEACPSAALDLDFSHRPAAYPIHAREDKAVIVEASLDPHWSNDR